MSKLRDKLRHAFATDESRPLQLNELQQKAVDRVAMEVARRRLTTPALLFMEMSRPLNYLAAQAMHFLHPVATLALDAEGYRQFAAFLEHRGSIDHLCRRIEHFEAEYGKVETPKSPPESPADTPPDAQK